MSTNNRRILLSCAALAVTACICVAAMGIGGLGTSFLNRTPASPHPVLTLSSGTSTPAVQAVIPGVSTPAPGSLTPLPGPTLSPAISQQMDQIQAQVESYRGLHATTPVTRGLLTSAQLRQRVLGDFLKDYTAADAKNDATELAAFGLLPANFDFLTFQENFMSEQIAGFYDDTTKEMYVITDEGFGGVERFNYAHEFTHVLQDQTFNLQGKLGYSDAKCKHASERCAAIQALIEGDAVLSQEQWLIQFSTALDRQQISQFSQSLNTPIYNSASEFYKEDAMFPYTQGLEFVQTLFDQGGWQAVDKAYLNPPVSTEQILHPNLYPSDTPVTVTLPDLAATLGQDWKSIDTNSLGEWYTYLLLAAAYNPADRLSTNLAKTAAAGWGGDAYTVLTDNQTGGLVLAAEWKWDTTQDAAEFAQAFSQYGQRPVGKGDLLYFRIYPVGVLHGLCYLYPQRTNYPLDHGARCEHRQRGFWSNYKVTSGQWLVASDQCQLPIIFCHLSTVHYPPSTVHYLSCP